MLPTISRKQSSLYAQAIYNMFPDNTVLLQRPVLVINPDIQDTTHLVRLGDRLDTLAFTYYKDRVENASKYWWVIAEANNIICFWELNNLVGKEILIPDILRVIDQITD